MARRCRNCPSGFAASSGVWIPYRARSVCAAKSPLTLKLLKRNLLHGADMPLPAALAHEQAVISLVLDSADAHEGCRAFLEKRPAQFRGE